VLEAYLDESGTDERSPVVAVGCYGGHHDEWMAFEDAWNPILRCAGIDCFHATDRRCDPLWPLLLETIQARKVQGLLLSVRHDDYKVIPTARFKSTLGNAYGACTFGCALQMAAWARENNHGPVAVVIEDGQPNIRFVKETLEEMIGDEAFNIAAVTIARKRDFVPLQAADFLSHCCSLDRMEWLRGLIGDGYGQALQGHYTPDDLRRLSQQMEEAWKQRRYGKRQARLAARAARSASGTS
jgi:hypothetical protein